MLPLVFVDADVLWSTTLRGWLVNLSVGQQGATSPAFQMVVSEDVIAEAVARWRDRHPTAPGAVTAKMSNNLRTLCAVVQDSDASIPFPGGDEGDVHVHAAAVHQQVGYLVTNDRGFHDLSDEQKDTLPYEIYSPDDLFLLLCAQSSQRVREATRAQMRHFVGLGQEPRLVESLRNAGCPEFAEAVRGHLAFLAGAELTH
ncbi:hypothetical protein C5C31_13240 [Rathayibacter rathayi]|uniref:hypothetical protein n=1 Tax=Rathayibacter rathayi TaxID=33887 RepID=UPI000CE7DE6F|nr:hypothetical protein [Rathayibacter rathayi]PPG65626.1 hypothetical protein C5C02_13420 [Rathayibacter rathayi]PPG73406.1 hypothetical protein C5C23_14490 [Rathayibacter rathayi]PPH19490.1 hypothetical protein C5C31_13240 [Rathayibacter rathayi]PPI75442.1 hypothetical protein C5E03_13870 [Rathayibacter rathayi]